MFQIRVKKLSRWVPEWTQNARSTSGACLTMPTSKTSFNGYHSRISISIKTHHSHCQWYCQVRLMCYLWYVKWLKNPSARPTISLFLQELLLCNLESWNFNFNPRGIVRPRVKSSCCAEPSPSQQHQQRAVIITHHPTQRLPSAFRLSSQPTNQPTFNQPTNDLAVDHPSVRPTNFSFAAKLHSL